MSGISQNSGFSPARPYNIKVSQNQEVAIYNQAGTWVNQKYPLTGPLQGFTKAVSPDTCKSANSAFISATVPQAQMNHESLLQINSQYPLKDSLYQ